MALWLPLVLVGLVASSQLVTNPEDLSKRFAQAQRLLATGDFAGAQQVYESVLAVPDGALLRASDVRVVVDERRVGVQAAARYQLANLARKQAQLWRKEAVLANAVEDVPLAAEDEAKEGPVEPPVEAKFKGEKQQIVEALQASEGRIYGERGAARLLGMNPERLRSRMRVFGLQRPKKGL